MRSILFLPILLAIGCSGQNTNKEQVRIDTAKLFNPNPQPGDRGAEEMNIFKRNIFLTQPNYYIIFNDVEHELKTIDKVSDYIKLNKAQIQKGKFYIIVDSSTAFKKVVSVINLLVENQITNYKVINIQSYFTPPEPVTIQEPTSVTTREYNDNDSTLFQIEILKTGLNLKLLGLETNLTDTTGLDKFINLHKSDIKEILLIYAPEFPKERFLAVLEIMKRHDYKKFRLITKQ